MSKNPCPPWHIIYQENVGLDAKKINMHEGVYEIVETHIIRCTLCGRQFLEKISTVGREPFQS